MATVAGVVDIWNFALSRMGHSPIANENEGSAEANLCRRQWPLVRDAYLEDFDWAFARRYGPLVDINDDAELVDGWLFAYAFPIGNVVCVRGIPDPSAPGDAIPMTTMLRQSSDDLKILSDLADACAFWTVKITDATRYPPSFVNATSYAMEAVIYMSISKEKNKQKLAGDAAKNARDVAQVATMDRDEPRPTDTDESPRTIRARQ